jgi:hypothetical protein
VHRPISVALALGVLAACKPPPPQDELPPEGPVLTLSIEARAAGKVEVHVVYSNFSDTDPSAQICAAAACSFSFASGSVLRLWATVDGLPVPATWSGRELLSTQVLRLDVSTTVEVKVEDFNLAFVTRSLYSPGVLGDGAGGVGAADTLCVNDAYERGFPGHFIAYLSTSVRAARDRIPAGVRGWVTLATPGILVHEWSSQRVLQPLSSHDQRQRILTGSTGWGTPAVETCNDWTSSASSASYRAGDSSEGLPGLLDATTYTCDQPGALLCLQIDHARAPQAVQPRPEIGAFITAGTYAVGGGVKAFDQACADEAAKAGLTRIFVASVATNAESPSQRAEHNPYYRWTRADGVALRPSAGLLQLTVENKVLLRADPGIPSIPDALIDEARVWTGSTHFNNLGNETCNDWVSPQGTGNVTWAHQQDWGNQEAPCSGKYHLFCVERG